MGALTQNERDGLEDVFLSIQGTKKYKKIQLITVIFNTDPKKLNFKKLLKQAKIGLNETKLSHFLLNFAKKKKNLSK
jgi:hypothetical protein